VVFDAKSIVIVGENKIFCPQRSQAVPASPSGRRNVKD
jgi:hypothetical protein